jgi:ABC-type arginine/histidine transport system permease subunit
MEATIWFAINSAIVTSLLFTVGRTMTFRWPAALAAIVVPVIAPTPVYIRHSSHAEKDISP